MSSQIIMVFAVLGVTIFLFISELLRVDIIAILIMISLAWLRLVTPSEAFAGLSSNAVVSVIAVMIIGYGIDRSGVMKRITRPITKMAGSSEKRLIGIVSSAVAGLSAFMQNIGAAALFLPALVRISKNTKIPISRLLMPMGFAAILGGTLSMVGSGSLIILNDLLKQGGQKAFGLFSVTPIGLVLVTAGIGYFLLFGKIILPSRKGEGDEVNTQQKMIETWQLPCTIYQCTVSENSPIIGKTREDIKCWRKYNVNLLAISEGDDMLYAPWRYTRFAAGQKLAFLGDIENVKQLADDFKLDFHGEPSDFEDLRSAVGAGFAEVLIPPRSSIAGKTIRDIAMRKNYSVEPIMLLDSKTKERSDFSDEPLEVGNAIIVHGLWRNIKALKNDNNFVLATPVESEDVDKSRPLTAMFCFLVGIGLAFSGFPLSVSLLTGAIGMILFKVITIDEAYKAVDWRTVFLLAGLIPLGTAMDKTGAAKFVADQMMQILQGQHVILVMMAFGVLSTIFSLFMSNVAATVLLVPLVMIMGNMTGINPRTLALLVGVCASNSFILPTHQVNALLMSPGGYKNSDYVKAGGIMSILFIIIAVGFLYLFYL
ncbi:SLC13 family permease [Candidatus Poribacteria bacterium]|nr:SLC13 family permease [Candidatus Poribacteria bacterium]